MAKRIPQLRKGLSPQQLLEGGWTRTLVLDEPEDDYYPEFDYLRAAVIKLACERVIAEANSGERVTRMDIKNNFAAIAYALKCASETIRSNLTEGKIEPTILDQIANV
jgi:hypothetical protein